MKSNVEHKLLAFLLSFSDLRVECCSWISYKLAYFFFLGKCPCYGDARIPVRQGTPHLAQFRVKQETLVVFANSCGGKFLPVHI